MTIIDEEDRVKPINVYQFYQMATYIHTLTELRAGAALKTYFYPIAMARFGLFTLAEDKLIPIPVTGPIVWKVMAAINNFFPAEKELLEKLDMEKTVTPGDLYGVIEAAKEFENVFSAELQNMAIYLVSKKGIFDTNDLIARADDLFPESIKKELSEQARVDIRETGKCLAFDLATAAGFHMARTVETVLLDYLKLLCPKIVEELKESQRNLGSYIKMAEENGGEPKICSSLNQFRELHRNPLIHPESVLTVEEAVTLLGITQSSIVGMVQAIIKKKGATLPLTLSS